MKEAGKEAVRMISFTTATSNGRNRADGFVKGLEEGGLTVEVLNEYLGDSRESYMTSCEDALVTYPELDLVFAANAQGGLGAYDACVAANRPEVKIVGFDCEDEEVELIDKGTQYIASVMQLPAAWPSRPSRTSRTTSTMGRPLKNPLPTSRAFTVRRAR